MRTTSSEVWAPWASPLQQQAAWRAAWAALQAPASASSVMPWRLPPKVAARLDFAWHGHLPRLALRARVAWAAPPQVHALDRIRWGRGDGMPWFIRPPKPVEPPPSPSPFPDGRRVGLNLGCPVFRADPRRIPLNLGITACWNARLQRRAYIVLNEFSVVRLPDRLPIDVDRISLAGGRDDAFWSASLALADPEQLPELAPTADGPRAVEITINGYPWVVEIESFGRDRVFGARDVSVQGRSATVRLSDPFAAPRTREVAQARTMVQLADAEVAGTGITVDYGTVNWLVTGGAWYYEGLTPMAALTRLAEASGGVVQSHPAEPVVQIRARYPVSPWHWTTSTPDVVIQDDIVTGERLQLQSRPLYDAVIVAGERVGVAAKVKRDGEAGQNFAPQQVDQLITHADGARERGRNVLSDRGGQALVEQEIPLFGGTLQPGQPGLVLPLMLAQRITGEGTWHGLVVGVRIEASRQDRAVDVVQTVTLERHYTDAD